MEKETLLDILKPFETESFTKKGGINKATLYKCGLSGAENSAALRITLAKKLGLPSKITPNALLSALNVLYTEKELDEICKGL